MSQPSRLNTQCCKFFKRPQDLKTHLKKSPAQGGCKSKPVPRTGTLTEKLAIHTQQTQFQDTLPHVNCNHKTIENVLRFSYLGISLQADGDRLHAATCRMAIAKTAFGTLRHIWADSSLSLKLKLRLYLCGIVSILSYGSETWDFSPKLMTRLRQWNARCLATLTSREIADEYRNPTVDLVEKLQARRTRWLVRTLKSEESHLAHTVLTAEINSFLSAGIPYPSGSPMALAPPHSSVEELIALAREGEIENHPPLRHTALPASRNPPRACRPPPGSLAIKSGQKRDSQK